MKPNRILSLLLSFVLVIGTLNFPATADFDGTLYDTAIHNIAAKCAQEDITKDVNFMWFLADMMVYERLYPESENVLSAKATEKCKYELLDFAESTENGGDLAKSIIAFRALGYDAQNIYKSDTEKLEIVEKLSALIDSKSQSVTNIYTLPYVAIAMREYATKEQSEYLLKAMIAPKQKEKWQNMKLGTDAATPMILALSPYYNENEEVKTVIDETVEMIKAGQNENGLISNAPSTGLAITALSSVNADDEDIQKLICGLLGETTPELDAFLPTINSFGTEQGFRGLLAYKLHDEGKSMYDFSDYPKNELKINSEETEKIEEQEEPDEIEQSHSGSGSNVLPKTENVSVTVKVMIHNQSECNNAYTYKHNPEKYRAILSKTIEIDKNLTVYDATVKVFAENDIQYSLSGKNVYFETINGLSEFDHGTYSGWQYMVDGKHKNVGCDQVAVKQNSVIIWYYTDDYTNEYGSETYAHPAKKAEEKETEKKETEKGSKTTVSISDTCGFLINTVQNPQVSSVGGEWAIIGLSASGMEVPKWYFDRYYENVENTVKEKNGILHSRKYTEYSRAVIALTLIGKNPENVAGYDLVKPICDFEKTTAQGLNGAIWALIALDSGNYADDEIKEKYVDYILSRELDGGGWAIAANETAADCDITAMALSALSNYTEREDVSKAVDRGVAFLSKIQNRDGGFSTYDEMSSESISQVITALSSLGIDVETFSKNGRTPIDALFDYYVKGGGFSHIRGGETNLMATEQALYALSSVKHFKSGEKPIFRTCKFYDIAGNKNETAILALSSRGIINGMGRNAFAPEENLTRAQFTVLLVKALNLEMAEKSYFIDVGVGDWFFGYVNCAYENGLVFGISENEFNPYGNITCEEAAAILSRAAALCGIENGTGVYDTVLPKEVSKWAEDSFAFCIDTGIIEKTEVSGKEVLARSKIAQMIYNLLKKAERI